MVVSQPSGRPCPHCSKSPELVSDPINDRLTCPECGAVFGDMDFR